MRRALVVSTVHPPDDPRLRYKLIPTLMPSFAVLYACRTPGPTSRDGLDYRPLAGGRLRRDLAASRLLLGGSYDVASVHDPELLPAVILAGLLRRPVVFDLHENLPAQLATRPGWPGFLRSIAAAASRLMLRVAERVARVTTAEAGYGHLFRGDPPVFPNYPFAVTTAPRPADAGAGVVYLGDVTPARGLGDAVRATAASQTGLTLTLIGRCAPAYAAELEDSASRLGVDLRLRGYLALEHALDLVAGSVVAVSPLRDGPNYRDSLPTKVLEYLAVGTPVVATDLPGTARVIGELPGVLLVPPGDITAMGRAIASVASSAEMREEAADGAAAVVDGHRWPEATVVGFYEELAS